ncbi:DUF6289 family protein [Lysobacter capsici]|jgi:hypothetical protein|uniref:DUF6289 family protein n=1 Tax=Lysobacter capsici TaxID=435897 RepID=UPI000628126F|nr:DUF6289 family protein [Lysobacter capsici]ALN84383.1 hypothetical protein LC55x_1091 [Lysobacter capsici]UOF15988.1 DUF6289 family protein [Lysobacter capsici]WND81711.1 DUF6289 family protein [Lysobacter capsici]WND86907.1 DUF6289 family protein [Lysobacter capsici]
MRYIAIATLTAVLAAAATIGSASAAPPWQGYSITYFDSAGEVVGGATANCGGQYLSWGEHTDVFEKRTWICD